MRPVHHLVTPASIAQGSPPHRHRIALVLGSGGVRSAAAIGIVERLAREDIEPDLVVGCSSGALFGAFIASGMRTDEALQMALRLWSPGLTQQLRWRAVLQMLLPRLAGFDADFALRSNRLIAERLHCAFGTLRLEELRTPLRVVTTEAATGRRVVLSQGLVVNALLASMALPFVFPSVVVDGKRLVDGVVSDPLPVGVADDAALVLALGFHGAMPRRPNSAKRLAQQASTALVNNLAQARLDAALARGQRIVSLHPTLLRRVGLWETGALAEVCEAGRRAAQASLPALQAALCEPASRKAA